MEPSYPAQGFLCSPRIRSVTVLLFWLRVVATDCSEQRIGLGDKRVLTLK